MRLNELKPAEGSKRNPKRVGRGIGSTDGKTGGRGHKGQKSRSGGFHKVGFEGGQNPIHRRVPKRGFVPLDRVEVFGLNVGRLDVFEDGAVVDVAAMRAKGLLPKRAEVVKLLGTGEISKKLTVKADRVSASAKAKIEAAGGSVELAAPAEAKAD